jgi:hypothetical protein
MSTVHALVTTALSAVLSNTWAIELPPEPSFPAIVFAIDTEQEEAWCMGGGYDQHLVTVTLLYDDFDALDAAKPLVRAAMEGIGGPVFMFEEASGDASFEDLPDVFAYAMTFRLRTARY